MKKLTGCIVFLMALCMFSGAAMAWDNTEHVTLAPNGVGDMLHYPMILALDGGWETKIVVVNTSPTIGVVCKVVIRSGAYSQELLDFLIYLSPTDVWWGTIRYGASGPELYSTDDSVQYRFGTTLDTFASEENPFIAPLDPLGNLCPGDSDSIVYANIFEAWWLDYGTSPIAKDVIYGDYWAAGADFGNGTANVLYGFYELMNAALSWMGSQRAEILKDYDVNQRLTLGVETRLGIQSRNNLCEVEAIWAKNFLAMYYYNLPFKQTLHALTLPTKLTQLVDCVFDGNLGPFFNVEGRVDSQNCIEYGLRYYDLSENTPGETGEIISPVPEEERHRLCFELNFAAPATWQITGALYEEGWARYGFEDDVTTCRVLADSADLEYTGAPIIGTNVFFQLDGVSIMEPGYEYGSIRYLIDDGAAPVDVTEWYRFLDLPALP